MAIALDTKKLLLPASIMAVGAPDPESAAGYGEG
jgi:hypothetical protein